MELPDDAKLATEGEGVKETFDIRSRVIEYLSARCEVFRGLEEVKAKGWANEAGDTHFKQQRQVADQSTDSKSQRFFFGMMQRIAAEMQESTGALQISRKEPQIMDLCMAPGGYTASAIKVSPRAIVFGVTLPQTLSGHPVLLKDRLHTKIVFTDNTMEAAELGVTVLPEEHPELNLFKTECLLPADRKFDLVFCDGQVLRPHAKYRHADREPHEATRLTSAQLIIAMQHMNPGGTLIILLHRSEAWDTLKLLQAFDKFSRIQLFKPTKSHVSRSSFYLIAQDIKPDQEDTVVARKGWLQNWKDATFDQKHVSLQTVQELTDMLETFGARIIELAEPIWKLQIKRVLRNPDGSRSRGMEGRKCRSLLLYRRKNLKLPKRRKVPERQKVPRRKMGPRPKSAGKEEGAEKKTGDTGSQAI